MAKAAMSAKTMAKSSTKTPSPASKKGAAGPSAPPAAVSRPAAGKGAPTKSAKTGKK